MKDIKQRLILREWNVITVVAFWLALFVISWPVGVKVARHEVLPQNRSWPIHLAGVHTWRATKPEINFSYWSPFEIACSSLGTKSVITKMVDYVALSAPITV